MRSVSSTPAGRRTVDPVAMIASSNVTVSVPPSESATSIVLASRKLPNPSISVMEFF